MTADLERLIETSLGTRPRLPETQRAFDDVIKSVFVPPLKERGFKKRRLMWFRDSGEVWPTLQVFRHYADGDFIDFWIEWGLYVPSFSSRRWGGSESIGPVDSPLRGRSGDFADAWADYHWFVAMGNTGRARPNPMLVDISTEIHTHLVEWTLPFLEKPWTIVSLIDHIKLVAQNPGDRLFPGLVDRPEDAVAILRSVADEVR